MGRVTAPSPSAPPSQRSSHVPWIRYGWQLCLSHSLIWLARIAGSVSGKMDQVRWLWRTLQHSGLLTFYTYFFSHPNHFSFNFKSKSQSLKSGTILHYSSTSLNNPLCFISTPPYRAIPNLVYFYPSDAVSACRAVELAANYKNMTFIRTSRPATPVIYANDETFEIGKAKVCEHDELLYNLGFVLCTMEGQEIRLIWL